MSGGAIRSDDTATSFGHLRSSGVAVARRQKLASSWMRAKCTPTPKVSPNVWDQSA